MSKSLASVKTLTAKEIADKFNLPLAAVAKKIAAGVKVEKEHTTSIKQANEIARDHLGERPDYYDKLSKMEKAKVVKENTTVTAGIGGLGFNTGTPAIAADNAYTDTNSMSYDDINGAILKMIKNKHDKHLVDMGFTSYSPNDIQASTNRVVKEAKHPLQANYDKYRKGELNELGEYDNKGGMSGYEGTSGPIRAIRKNEMKPIKERSTGKMPADMSAATERGIYQEYWMPFLQQHHKHSARLSKEKSNKPDTIMDPGAGGTTHTTREETKMDNKELINEALDCILEDNLSEMKDNLLAALQEKAIEKLEERKKEIAANYFAQ